MWIRESFCAMVKCLVEEHDDDRKLFEKKCPFLTEKEVDSVFKGDCGFLSLDQMSQIVEAFGERIEIYQAINWDNY